MGNGDTKGPRLRLPTLELYSALHGGSLALKGRPLTLKERKDAEFVFKASIDLDKVRVVNALVANAPTTLGNYIRVGMDGKVSRTTMIHELAHIWQYQTKGTSYISNSLCAQVTATVKKGTRNAAYTVTKEDLKKANSIHDLPAEKQAVVIETYFAHPSVRTDAKYKKFINEVQSARPLPEALILEEAAFGPNIGKSILDSPNYKGQDATGTVPLIRLEF